MLFHSEKGTLALAIHWRCATDGRICCRCLSSAWVCTQGDHGQKHTEQTDAEEEQPFQHCRRNIYNNARRKHHRLSDSLK